MNDTKAGPKNKFYAMVDGTHAIDSAVFGVELETKAKVWMNILHVLNSTAPEPTLLRDSTHDYVLVYIYKPSGSAGVEQDAGNGAPVLCASGHEGEGFDDAWQNYNGGVGAAVPPDTKVLKGRHLATERTSELVRSFFLRPVMAISSAKGRIASDVPPDPNDYNIRADLLYISSHGWLGGFAMGDYLTEYPGALPAEAQPEYVHRRYYFSIGELEASGSRFEGPSWIILAQCSTLNDVTWPLWAPVMARSSPQVRGILGYEEASPAAEPSAKIARNFVRATAAGKSLFEAWKEANAGQNWSAIVHKDAMKDSLKNWDSQPYLVGNSMGDYLGACRSSPTPRPIVPLVSPFEYDVEVQTYAPSTKLKVEPKTLHRSEVNLRRDEYVFITFKATTDRYTKVTAQWIHIRPTTTQYKRQKIFQQVSALAYAADGSEVSVTITEDSSPATIVTATASKACAKIILGYLTQPASTLDANGIEAHHAYFWPRLSAQGPSLPLSKFDARTNGINYR